MSPRRLAVLALIAAAISVNHVHPLAQRGSDALLSQLTWFDRSGRRLGTVGPPGNHSGIELSPDGREVAVAVRDTATGARDLWMYDTTSGARRRYTNTPEDENWVIWSRDGRTLTFNATTADGTLDLYQAPAASGAQPRLLLRNGMWPVSWAPDGRNILFVINTAATGNDVMVLPLTGDRRPYPFAQTADAENWAAFSPDGRWVAFSSTETGTSELYVAAFPPSREALAGKVRISTNGGSQARWTRDGTQLLYVGEDGALMSAAVNGAGGAFEVGTRTSLFQPRFYFFDSHGFDVAPDGRILVNTVYIAPSNRAPSTVAMR